MCISYLVDFSLCFPCASEYSMCFICSNYFGSCGNSELGVLRDQSPHEKDGGLMASCMGSHSLEIPGS